MVAIKRVLGAFFRFHWLWNDGLAAQGPQRDSEWNLVWKVGRDCCGEVTSLSAPVLRVVYERCVRSEPGIKGVWVLFFQPREQRCMVLIFNDLLCWNWCPMIDKSQCQSLEINFFPWRKQVHLGTCLIFFMVLELMTIPLEVNRAAENFLMSWLHMHAYWQKS